MSSCSAMLGQRGSRLLRLGGSRVIPLGPRVRGVPGSMSSLLPGPAGALGGGCRFRCLLEDVGPRLAVSSSLAAGNAIAAAAAAAAGPPGAGHSAVTQALAHVAVTAVAIASGACLSTKVDFLWPRAEDQPDSLILDGVDLTGYPIFNDAKVLKAIDFARKAHHGQVRKTGEPYVTHCICAGKILAALVPSSGNRAANTVVAGILHDVIDDTFETLHRIKQEFGSDVANLVAGVSKLSYINQLLRRHRRRCINQSALTSEEANKLRAMLLGMVDDPRMVLIKLADRLHNMRTIYGLSLPKAQAVAQETLSVWCSLASRLGVWALKAELEDLCFAVLQPDTFRQMHAELASMWSSDTKGKSPRRISMKPHIRLPLHDASLVSDNKGSSSLCDDMANIKELLQAVLPFDLLLDRRKRINFLNNLNTVSGVPSTKPKVVSDSGIALASLVLCEEALERELFISTSYIPGMEVTLSSRLKSLYSIYCKMKRKGVGIRQVYDARALRVVVGDKNGTLHGPAVKSCYSLLDIVHRLWTPIDGEFDDYIVNPKPSGYQSLHTAVQGPDSAALEVQIRTQRMHEYAESGLAAHWLYKESDNKIRYASSVHDGNVKSSSYEPKDFEDETSQDNVHPKYGSLKVGHPVLRVEGSQLRGAVIIRVDQDGRDLLVGVNFELEASEALADRRYSTQIKYWEAYAKLYKKVSDKWWFAPGHGDWCTCLEKYTLCRDGMYHKQDQFQRLLPTFIQVIDLTEQESAEYWMVVSAIFEGKQIASISSNLNNNERQSIDTFNSSSADTGINNKVQLLRTMLQWEEQVRHEASLGDGNPGAVPYSGRNPAVLNEVVIICWPHGGIMRMRSGSTAADAARRIGLEGRLVCVNGQLAVPQTELKDGDIVDVRS
uniref:GTP diphosphokinase n=1 Tax=Anthurium amnicola TaxID=1678845 RepID=A0A1D1XPH1_9ARAE